MRWLMRVKPFTIFAPPPTIRSQADLPGYATRHSVRRPTDRQLLDLVATKFDVNDVVALTWLYDMDLDGLSDQLIGEAREAA